jgi:hypothetical protein
MKKKFINEETIEGYVYSTGESFNALQERVTGENSKNPGTKYIAGNLDIAVDEKGLNVITIHYSYVTEKTKSGSVNNTYATLKKIIDNPSNTWIAGGKENAYKVLCTSVSIGINDFIGRDGNKVAATVNEGGFCSIVSALGEEKERNKFKADMLITRVVRIDADPEKNIEKDYVKISGAIFGWGPKILPVSFDVHNEDGMKYFENLNVSSSNPVFTAVWGRINRITEKLTVTEDSAFGEVDVQIKPRKNRAYVVTGTSKVPYDFGDENFLTAEDVNKMNQERQIMLAEVEKKHNERQVAKASTGVSFDAAAAAAAANSFSVGDYRF